jgi:uncharacterized protein involved in exopolysaccharide biosynthesis
VQRPNHPDVERGPSGSDVEPERPEDSDALFDFTAVRESLDAVGAALQRHWVAALVALTIALAGVATVAATWPRTYEVDGRLLVLRNDVMASLVNPERTVPREAESPTWAAEEIVHARENLVKIMQATNLVEEWDRTRSPLLKAKDWVLQPLRGPRSEDDRIDALAGLLTDRLQVGTTEQGAVSFFIRWPEPHMARALVDEAMKSFLEYRRVSETAAISESIAILDQSVTDLEEQISETASRLPRRPAARPHVARAPTVSGPSAKMVVQLSRLKAELDARQQEVARLEGLRFQQLSEAQARLSAAQTVYTDGHPTVTALRREVAQLSRDSQELAAARRQARELETQHDTLSVAIGMETARAERARAGDVTSPTEIFTLTNADDASPVSLRLRVEMSQLAALRERARAARTELATAEAGFKYRYTVTRPPRVPRGPSGPNILAIVLAGAVASMIAALAVALLADWAGDRIRGLSQVLSQVTAR